jgi:23S rRNA (cytidine2498-2'-O)-methyltransferase
MSERCRFLFTTCQVGAEGALKGELTRRWPEFRLAFSRPGFLTFKLPEAHQLCAEFDLESVFARAYGFSLGKATGQDPRDLAQGVWELAGERSYAQIHVWPRDAAEPGREGFEPSITVAALEAREAILRHCPRPAMLDEGADPSRRPVRLGRLVLDCVLVEPNGWWVGYHQVGSVAGQWPGGIMPLQLPTDAVSRAWLKTEEAMRWSQLPITRGAQLAELGSAPGGSSQALLDRGLNVTGIDPAEMHPTVLGHPNFTHLRRRAAAVPRRELRKIRWLTADLNVAPNCTLDAVEEIVSHGQVSIRGLLLTLKLLHWDLADRLPEYVRRVRRWGYNIVRARQLVHNRREVCLAALQKPFRRKW